MSASKSNHSYEVITHEDSATGDIILPLPAELLEQVGWKEGDEIKWVEGKDGAWILQKKS